MDPGKLILGATVAVVLVSGVVLYGVFFGGGPFGGGDGVPASVAEIEDEDLPDGIEKNGGVTNASAVAVAHDDSLSSTSYTAVLVVNTTRDSPTREQNTRQRLRHDGNGRYLVERTARNGTGAVQRRVDIWIDESGGTLRLRDPNPPPGTDPSPRIREVEEPDELRREVSRALVEDVLGAGNYRIENVTERDGQAFYTLRAENADPDAASELGDVRSVSSYNGTVRVAESGRVYSLEARIVYTSEEGENVTRVFEYELGNVGSTSVERPEWVPSSSLVRPALAPGVPPATGAVRVPADGGSGGTGGDAPAAGR